MEYYIENNKIYENSTPIVTINVNRKGLGIDSIDLSGQVNIKIKRSKGKYEIYDGDILSGYIGKDFEINYLGSTYRVDRKNIISFMNGATDSIKITSLGTEIANIKRDGNRLFISSDKGLDRTVMFIYLAIFSSFFRVTPGYAGRRIVYNLPLPYRIAYYVFIFGALIFLIFTPNIGIYSAFLFFFMIIIAQIIRYLGYRKGNIK